jgi:hypothetical protein
MAKPTPPPAADETPAASTAPAAAAPPAPAPTDSTGPAPSAETAAAFGKGPKTITQAAAVKPPPKAPPPPTPGQIAAAKLKLDTPLRLHLAAEVLSGGRITEPRAALSLVDILIDEACKTVTA